MQIANDAVAQQLYQQRMNDFIEKRTKIESEVNAFLRSLEVDDEEFRAKCNVQEGLTARDVLPSLWAEEFDEAAEKGLELLEQPLDAKYPDGYLFVTMGAGDNWKVGKKIIDLLCRS